MHTVGEIIVIQGKTYQITATDGVNYAYKPYEKEAEEKPRKRKKAEE